MTYGYRGTVEVIDECKKLYPDVEVRLGGIYPTLCYDHAREHTKADVIYKGECPEFKDCLLDYEVMPNPPQYIIVQLCKGCPNKCKFCAVSYLDGPVVRYVDIDESIENIKFLNNKYGLDKIKLWGSNLLMPKKGKLFEEWLDKLIALDKNFTISCPEGFAPELITVDICRKLEKAGFRNVVIPLEEANKNALVNNLGKVYNIDQWERAIGYAIEGGVPRSKITVPIIIGTPGQTPQDILDFMKIYNRLGVKPWVSKYIPVPKSQWYEESEYFKSLDLEYCNGILYPAITDVNIFKPLSRLTAVLMESLVSNYGDRIKRFLEEENGGIMSDQEKEKPALNSKDLIGKMAVLLVDIAEQNKQIIDLLGKVLESKKNE
jgi:radical SAM superfamily enzyme YgiQ (UPF0313 family)